MPNLKKQKQNNEKPKAFTKTRTHKKETQNIALNVQFRPAT
jgi:hypothetical protein